MRIDDGVSQTRVMLDTGNNSITLHSSQIGSCEFDHRLRVVPKGTRHHVIAIHKVHVDIGGKVIIDTKRC